MPSCLFVFLFLNSQRKQTEGEREIGRPPGVMKLKLKEEWKVTNKN